MDEFKKELKELLEKHGASIFVEQEENDSFLYLQLIRKGIKVNIDSGYRDLSINPEDLK